MSAFSKERFMQLQTKYGKALGHRQDYSDVSKLPTRIAKSSTAFGNVHKATIFGILINEAHTSNIAEVLEFARTTANYIVERCHPDMANVPDKELLELSVAKYGDFKTLALHKDKIMSVNEALHDHVRLELINDRSI